VAVTLIAVTPATDDDGVTRSALAAKAGDRAAATAFVEATYAQVQRFLGHLCDPWDVEDLTQETYLRAMRGLGRFAARSTARTWLLAIARRVAADHVRAATRRPRTAPLDGREAAAQSAAGRHATGFENGLLLRHLLDGLPPQRREAFVATQVLGLSYDEAAQVCDCPVGTIRSRVARARADLVAAYRHDPASGGAGTGVGT
jgi:RNA polymerase sigma-70 factor, ECF subfamily